ncbi:MAG TPA: 30S ribosomal protein S16 [Actinomycetota bacterium]
MVRIRLLRTGKRKQPSYRVVVADQRSPRDGRFVEIIGNYNPLTNPSQITLDEERALHWLGRGAQPSESAMALLKRMGIWQKHKAARKTAKTS